jgi:hypothetical protein
MYLKIQCIMGSYLNSLSLGIIKDHWARRGRDRMLVGFITNL